MAKFLSLGSRVLPRVAARAPAARLCALPALQLNAPVVASSAARALLSQPRRAFASSSFLDKADVTDRVTGCLKNFQKVDPTKVSETSHFLNDLGLDSLDTVEVVMAFEDEFCIEIPDADAEKIHSCEDAISYIIQHPHAK